MRRQTREEVDRLAAKSGLIPALAIWLLVGATATSEASGLHPWSERQNPPETLQNRVAPPPWFDRTVATAGSFAEWLRGLPLKPAGAPVKLYNGAEKSRHDVTAAVIDIDVGTRDLQQCADAVMRLRAEWLFAARSLKR